jgi:hypothetical protein
MSFTPDAANHRHVAGDMHADQVGALADRDRATVVQANRFGRRLADMRTAEARSIAGTCFGRCSAAISRLDGI